MEETVPSSEKGAAKRTLGSVLFAMVGTPRCGVTGRVQRTESLYPLLCLHSVAPLNAARSSQRDDPTLKLQTVPLPPTKLPKRPHSCYKFAYAQGRDPVVDCR